MESATPLGAAIDFESRNQSLMVFSGEFFKLIKALHGLQVSVNRRSQESFPRGDAGREIRSIFAFCLMKKYCPAVC
jgi:hypothetical protein